MITLLRQGRLRPRGAIHRSWIRRHDQSSSPPGVPMTRGTVVVMFDGVAIQVDPDVRVDPAIEVDPAIRASARRAR